MSNTFLKDLENQLVSRPTNTSKLLFKRLNEINTSIMSVPTEQHLSNIRLKEDSMLRAVINWFKAYILFI